MLAFIIFPPLKVMPACNPELFSIDPIITDFFFFFLMRKSNCKREILF